MLAAVGAFLSWLLLIHSMVEPGMRNLRSHILPHVILSTLYLIMSAVSFIMDKDVYGLGLVYVATFASSAALLPWEVLIEKYNKKRL
jgi:hypothetical protein